MRWYSRGYFLIFVISNYLRRRLLRYYKLEIVIGYKVFQLVS